MLRQFDLTSIQLSVLTTYQTSIGHGIKYIPVWLTVLMVVFFKNKNDSGLEQIVVNIGEKIGPIWMINVQGATAELATASLIFVADRFDLPVSTIHVLISGIITSW